MSSLFTMQSDLLACPFCGSNNLSIKHDPDAFEREPAQYVHCDNCDIDGPKAYQGKHVTLWNTRYLTTPPVQQPAAVAGQSYIYQAKSPEEDVGWQDLDEETYAHAMSNGFECRIVCTALVPAAGVQGDADLQTALTVFDMGLGFALCHRDFGDTRAAVKQLQKDFESIRTMIGRTSTQKPDSGRDAALEMMKAIIAVISYGHLHPEAPSAKFAKELLGAIERDDRVKKALAAHPANGAQVEQQVNIDVVMPISADAVGAEVILINPIRKYKLECFHNIDGKAYGTVRVPAADASKIPESIRCKNLTAIIAAAKKGDA